MRLQVRPGSGPKGALRPGVFHSRACRTIGGDHDVTPACVSEAASSPKVSSPEPSCLPSECAQPLALREGVFSWECV